MIVNDWAKAALKARRDRRDMRRAGWELVGEGGGPLWELSRGARHDHEIVDARPAKCGKAVWIKVKRKEPSDEA